MQTKQQSPLFTGRVEFIVHVANVIRPTEATIRLHMFIDAPGRSASDIKRLAHTRLNEQLSCAAITAEDIHIWNVNYCVLWPSADGPPEFIPIAADHATEVARMIAITTRTYLPKDPDDEFKIYGTKGQ